MWLGPNNYLGPGSYLGPNANGGGGGDATVADFNSRYSGITMITQFNELWATDAEDQFQTQAFGNAVGARVRHEEAYYRIENAQYSPVTMTYSASMDTIVMDFNENWPEGLSVADLNVLYEGMFFRDFNTMPLWRGE